MLVGAAPTDGIGAGWCRHSEYGRDKCATIAAGGGEGEKEEREGEADKEEREGG
jgi:hypothetical protein